MKYKISGKQSKVLENHIQSLIDSSINSIREESEDWGLGEMDELDEINSIDAIKIHKISHHNGTKVYIDIISNTDRDDFDNIIAQIEYMLGQWFPNLKLSINTIKHLE